MNTATRPIQSVSITDTGYTRMKMETNAYEN